MPTIYNMTCTSQGAGTEEGKPGWGQNQLLLEDSTALPVSVKPEPCPQTYHLSLWTQEPEFSVRIRILMLHYICLWQAHFASLTFILNRVVCLGSQQLS